MSLGEINVTVRPGFDEAERPILARLYWQAFGAKLGRVMGPGEKAQACIARAIRPDHALVARDGAGRVIGVAGFRSREGSFLDPGLAVLAAIYGRPGGRLRGFLLSLLASETDNRRFLVDGICVAGDRRGQGVGTALIEALAAEARRRGHAALKLEVQAQNRRALALYERLGFERIGGGRSALAGLLFRLPAWVTMARAV
jgi:ribosomal protein S18 acetylase RimI-like enzyme